MNDFEETADPLMGTIEHGGFISETPPDVDDFLNEAGLTGKAYVCTIKRAPKEGSGSKEFLPGSLKGTFLPIEECGKRFGPGQYFYCFAWTTRDPENTHKQKKIFKEYKIYLGSEWDDIHDEYMSEKWAKREKDIEQSAQRNRLQKASKGISPDEKQTVDPIEQMKQTMGVLKDLGVPLGGNNMPANTGDSSQMMMFMMQMMQKSSENTMQMFMQMSQQSTSMMIGMMKNNQPQGSNDMFKEIINMVTNTVDLKEALNPEKKGMLDKMFELAESVMPAILSLASKPLAERQQSPLVQTIVGSEDFATMAQDPAMKAEMIKKWDASHGVEQTDIILETVGMSRGDAPVQPATQQAKPANDIPEAEFSNIPEDNNPGDVDEASIAD